MKNIDQTLGGNQYARLRFGIGNNFSKGRQVDFVLGKWNNEEAAELDKLVKKAGEAVKAFGTIGIGHAMNQFNN